MVVADLAEYSRTELEAKLKELQSSGQLSEELVDLMFELDVRDAFGGNLQFKYSEEIRRLSEELGYYKGRCWTRIMEAAGHYLRSEHRQALDVFSQARLMVAELDDEPDADTMLRTALADVHKSLGNYQIAFQYAMEVLDLVDENGSDLQKGWLYHGIASASNDLGDYDRALDYARRALSVLRPLAERFDEPQVKVGIARCYIEVGTAYMHLDRHDEARVEFENSLPLFRETVNRIGEARALNDLGRLAQLAGRYEEAESLHRQSLQIRREIENRQSQSTSLLNLGELSVEQGHFEEGTGLLLEALEIAETTGARLRQYQIHSALSNAYERAGDFTEALRHERAYNQIKEDVSSDSLNGRIADMEMRHQLETAEKEAEIARLRNVELKQMLDELQATQARLVHAEKMASLGAMAAGIAHEIQNPLNFVTNFAQLSVDLSDELWAEMDQLSASDRAEATSDGAGVVAHLLRDLKENSDRILQHGRRADGIVRNMLRHAGGRSRGQVALDLNRLTKEYVDLTYHGRRAQDSTIRVSIEFELDDALPEVTAAPEEIGRVVVNLVGNALDALADVDEGHFEAEDPKLVVTTAHEDDWVVLRIKDNGRPIPQEARGRIFEPFFTTKDAGSGTGLGLSLSYDTIVQGHGGELALEEEGGWKVFAVRLRPDGANVSTSQR